MSAAISQATKRNWERLGLDATHKEQKLTKRANKTNSKEKILPLEYFSSEKNVAEIEALLKTLG